MDALALAPAAIFGLLAISGCAAREDVVERTAKIVSGYEVYLPEGEAPFPVAVLFHGCGGLVGYDGPKKILKRYAAAANDAGYAALIVDSFGPRGIEFDEALKTVCTGIQLRGRNRAGDVIAAVNSVLGSNLAQKDGIVLAGWSHGGWAILESMLVGMESDWQTSKPGVSMLDSIGSIYLTYPYCSFLAPGRSHDWSRSIEVHMIFAGNDTLTDPADCEKAVDGARRNGALVETETVPGVTHGFDEEDQTPNSRFVFDAAAAEARLQAFTDFLAAKKPGE